MPDIIAYNGGVSSSNHEDMLPIILSSTGHVTRLVKMKLEVNCPIQEKILAAYPNDGHECALVIGSLNHNLGELELVPTNAHLNVNRKTREKSNQWILSGNTTHRDQAHFRNSSWSILTYKFKLQRQSTELSRTRHLIAIAIIATLLTLWLPPRFVSQRLIAISLSAALNLFIISQLTHAIGSANNINLEHFVNVLLIINGSCLVEAVVVFFIASKCYSQALPIRLASAVNGPFGKLIGLEMTGITYDLKTEMSKLDESNGQQLCLVLQEEWILFGVLIDRICFAIAIFCIVSAYPRW